MEGLDPHQRPPDGIRSVYKKYRKMTLQDLGQDLGVVDPEREASDPKSKVSIVRVLDAPGLEAAFNEFAQTKLAPPVRPVPVYEHTDMPGLHIIPGLLPPELQTLLLSRLLHRDLSSPAHLTNIHTHYNLHYPSPPPEPLSEHPSTPTSSPSFFSLPPTSQATIATPKDPSVHNPLTAPQLLTKKMRWMTLGGQYDWTLKQYPDSAPPPFPPDIQALLGSVFSDTRAEAAIVNLYSPGDTLSVHRDVSEMCATGLISISLGCDAIFVLGVAGEETGEEKVLALRLRSGSAVYMSGESRLAWHGVPQIVPDTCPGFLEEWPADGPGREFEEWRGWMRSKRVNLNVRQMWES